MFHILTFYSNYKDGLFNIDIPTLLIDFRMENLFFLYLYILQVHSKHSLSSNLVLRHLYELYSLDIFYYIRNLFIGIQKLNFLKYYHFIQYYPHTILNY